MTASSPTGHSSRTFCGFNDRRLAQRAYEGSDKLKVIGKCSLKILLPGRPQLLLDLRIDASPLQDLAPRPCGCLWAADLIIRQFLIMHYEELADDVSTSVSHKHSLKTAPSHAQSRMHTLFPVAKYARAFLSNSSLRTGRGKDNAAVEERSDMVTTALGRSRTEGFDADRT